MTSLVEAWNTTGETDNGMATNLSSMSSNVDLFFLAGASRGKDITTTFLQAWNENEDLAMRTLLWLRDVRGGAGERQQFRDLLKAVAERNPDVARKLIPLVPEVGRYDDLLVLLDTPLARDASNYILTRMLMNHDGLAAKWMPRKGPVAARLRKLMGLNPRAYRRLLVKLSNVVETQMCANEWDAINFEHVPSVASHRYQAAFFKHLPVEFAAYISALEKGEAKVNASAIFPHDIVANIGPVSQAQWDSLPNYMTETSERVLPVCDVSGSMWGLPMHVSISLGLYISERNEGVFKDVVCTFSEKPNLVKLKTAKLINRVQELSEIDWGMNTDLVRVFRTILDLGVKHNVPESQMPTMMLIISDMEFDRCVSNGNDEMAIDAYRRLYLEAGYRLPKVVFWNVNGRQGNSPVTYKENGTALVSGFSPSILQSLLAADFSEFTPQAVMLRTIMKDKYSWQ